MRKIGLLFLLTIIFLTNSCNTLYSSNENNLKNNSWLHDLYVLNQKPLIPDNNICAKLQTKELKDTCFGRLVKVTGNSSFCSELSVDSLKKKCFLNITLSKGTFLACDQIPNELWKISCYYDMAVERKNATICSVFKTNFYGDTSRFKDICLARVARVTKNGTLCDEIVSNWKIDCFMDTAENNSKICMKLSERPTERDICVRGIAIKTKDLQTCSLLSKNDSIDDCRNSVFARLSIDNHDLSYCDKIVDYYKDLPVERESCYVRTAASTVTLESCNSIPEDTRDRCRYAIIREKKSPELCGTISDARTRDGCYIDILHALNKSELFDSNLCEKINNKYSKDECYFWAAKHNYPLACNKIQSDEYRDMCFSELAFELRNMSMCDFILDSYGISSCYLNYLDVEPNDDISICEKIKVWAYDGCPKEVAKEGKCKELADHSYNRCISNTAKSLETCEKITNKQEYRTCVIGITRRLVAGSEGLLYPIEGNYENRFW